MNVDLIAIPGNARRIAIAMHETIMKTASLPPLRVEPELRRKAENVLREGETLSAFLETAVRQTIRSREIEREFHERGIASRDDARRTGEYYSVDSVMDELSGMLAEARRTRDE